MNTAIELTYNINVACVSVFQGVPPSALSLSLEPNLNLFPAAIQNGHINLIIRCVIRLADERLSLDGIKSVLPPLCGPTPRYKIGKGVGDGTFWRRERVADVVAGRRAPGAPLRGVPTPTSIKRCGAPAPALRARVIARGRRFAGEFRMKTSAGRESEVRLRCW